MLYKLLNHKLILAILSHCFLMIGIYLFVLLPITQKTEVLQKLSLDIQNKISFEKANRLPLDKNLIDKINWNPEDIAIINDLSLISKKTHIQNFRCLPAGNKHFEIHAQGQFNNILEFLKQSLTMPYLITLTNWTLTQEKETLNFYCVVTI